MFSRHHRILLFIGACLTLGLIAPLFAPSSPEPALRPLVSAAPPFDGSMTEATAANVARNHDALLDLRREANVALGALQVGIAVQK
ncbi:MAG: hypothetical protein WC670_15995 [Pseudolabrys sp.]|jgi:hypothetical protein